MENNTKEKSLSYYRNIAMSIVAIASSLFYIISLNFIPTPPNIFRSVVVLSACLLTFLMFPAGKKPYEKKNAWFILDLGLIALSTAAFVYSAIEVDNLIERGGIDNTLADLIFGTIAVLVVLEIARRIIGFALPLIALIFILYTAFGYVIPGELGHNGYNYSRIVTALYSYDGILGLPTAVAGTFVAMFIVFGAFLEVTGVGDYFMDLAKGLAG